MKELMATRDTSMRYIRKEVSSSVPVFCRQRSGDSAHKLLIYLKKKYDLFSVY